MAKYPSLAKKVVVYVVVFSLLVILTGKLFFDRHPSNLFLLFYGLLVTSVILVTFFVAFVIYKDPYIEARKAKTPKLEPLVSCLVAVHNEQDNIMQCVESIIKQDYPNKEIILVDDASTDETLKQISEYARLHNVRIIELKDNVGKKRALAEAVMLAKGDLFMFSDSDCVLASDAISKIVLIFNHDKGVGAVSGHCRALNADHNLLTKIQDSWYEGQFSVRKAFESVFGCVTCVSGPLAVFRREAIFNFIPAWTDDMFLGQEFKFATDRTLTGFVLGSAYVGDKLKARHPNSPFVTQVDYPNKEWKIVYSKVARVWTIVPDTFAKVIKQQIRWKKSFIRNIFFTGKFYWRKPILPAIFYYSHILFVFAGPFIVFRHLVYLPFSGNFFTPFLYLLGIVFVGFCYGIAYKLENPGSHKWIYRPVMSVFSTLILSWLLFYSIFTVKKMVWHRT